MPARVNQILLRSGMIDLTSPTLSKPRVLRDPSVANFFEAAMSQSLSAVSGRAIGQSRPRSYRPAPRLTVSTRAGPPQEDTYVRRTVLASVLTGPMPLIPQRLEARPTTLLRLEPCLRPADPSLTTPRTAMQAWLACWWLRRQLRKPEPRPQPLPRAPTNKQVCAVSKSGLLDSKGLLRL